MGKAARIKAQRAEKFEREEKRPTGRYLTKKEQQEKRRRARKLEEQSAALAAKVAASLAKGWIK